MQSDLTTQSTMNSEKIFYERPEATVILIRPEGFLCMSGVMQFGSDINSSGNFNDLYVIDGGSF